MAISFPVAEPGDIYTEGEKTWVYDGIKWNSQKGKTQIKASDTQPAAPIEGMRWIDTSTGKMYMYYNSSWVEPTITS